MNFVTDVKKVSEFLHIIFLKEVFDADQKRVTFLFQLLLIVTHVSYVAT